MSNRERGVRGKGRELGTGPDPWLWAMRARGKGRELGTGPDPGL